MFRYRVKWSLQKGAAYNLLQILTQPESHSTNDSIKKNEINSDLIVNFLSAHKFSSLSIKWKLKNDFLLGYINTNSTPNNSLSNNLWKSISTADKTKFAVGSMIKQPIIVKNRKSKFRNSRIDINTA